MKNYLLKSALFISIIIGMIIFSCKPGSFTEEDAMLLQSKLEKEKMLYQDSLNRINTLLRDSLNRTNDLITYTLGIVDASKATQLKGSQGTEDLKSGITGVSVTMTQGSTTVTKTTSSTGMVTFDKLKKGLAALHITMAGYSEINAVIDFSSIVLPTSSYMGIEFGNMLPMIPLSGTSTGVIKGTVVCESDLTNKAPEPVPTGTKVVATVSTSSTALNKITAANILTISYDNLSLEATTDATGAFTMTVPGTSAGLDYAIKVSDFQLNQSLLMLTKSGAAVTGVQTVPTYFGSTFSSGVSAIPSVSPVIVTIGAPDYVYTQATATALISNVNGIEYMHISNAGSYYDVNNSFSNVPILSPTPGTGGNTAYVNITVNSFGQVTVANISSQGSGFTSAAEGATFTMPYINIAAKARVLTVNGTGGITSWQVTTAGQFYSRNNIDFYRSVGSGTGATLTFPTINDNGSYLYFSTAIQTPASALGTGYAVNDEFTLAVKSGMSDQMTGKVHLTTGTVTAINITNEGANYISGKVDVNITSPGLTGTTATATATVSNGKIATITITDGGTNYSEAPTVSIINKVDKIQAVATATLNSTFGYITGFTMSNTGEGYLAAPTVTITPSITGVGSGAAAAAVLSNGSVSALTLLNSGTGYTGINTPATAQAALASVPATVKGTATTIVYINLGTGRRTIEN